MNSGELDLIKISETVFSRYEKLGYEKLTDAERIFVTVWGLEGELNNGGFDQYYFNSAGDHAEEAVKALQIIGANHTSGIVRMTNDLFGLNGPSPDQNKRQTQLLELPEAATNKMVEADQDFLKYTDKLWELLEAYVRKNSAAFRH